MNHLLDQITDLYQYINGLDPEGVRKLDSETIDRLLDKGVVVDKTSGDYDVSSTKGVNQFGNATESESAANFFMVVRVSNEEEPGNNLWQYVIQQNFSGYELDPNGRPQTQLHHVPSTEYLRQNYLTVEQLENFLTMSPGGIEFPEDLQIGETGPA
jgi:hypothetical protein